MGYVAPYLWFPWLIFFWFSGCGGRGIGIGIGMDGGRLCEGSTGGLYAGKKKSSGQKTEMAGPLMMIPKLGFSIR
jgi:hypothetical protein